MCVSGLDQAFGDDFWKTKKIDNQSGNSTILRVREQRNRY